MKNNNKFLITAVIILAFSALAATFIFQKPFKARPYTAHASQWNGVDLNDIQAELELKEKKFPNLKKDCEKKIEFSAGKSMSDISFVYIPGFSATRKEISPVVESLAKQFSANYFLSRFPAHGESAMDYKNFLPQGFFDTLYEAVEIGEKLGKRKIFIGTSTGAALISAGLAQDLNIDAAVLIAPAYAIYPKNSWLLSTRLGSLFNFFLVDEIRSWTPKNPLMENYWNTSYHRDGVLALLQSVEYIRSLDFSGIKKPVLMLYTKSDKVVRIDAILEKFAQLKDPRKKLIDIPSTHHVLAGEFTSPQTTELVIKEIHNWLQSLTW